PCMPRHRRLGVYACAYVCVAVVLITGCAAPTELSFDSALSKTQSVTPAEFSPPDELAAPAADVVARPAQPGDSAQPSDSTPQAVEQSFTALLAQWVGCFQRPVRCDIARFTAPDSPERTRLGEALAFYANEQLRTKPDEGRLEWSLEALTFTSSDRVRLTTCEYDTRIYFDASMADTELGDIIFDSTIWTRRVEWTLAKVNESWQLWSRRIERRSPAVRFCAP
ncbi:MAG: hypothetical protein NWP78_04615, partial [Ilumatobacteraceae bacterium]|nr:hypothetical protein [Ilumatobacteraceae bacterium]